MKHANFYRIVTCGHNHPIFAWAEMESYRWTGDIERLRQVRGCLTAYYEALRKYLRSVVILTSIPASGRLHSMNSLPQTGSGMISARAGRCRPGPAEKRFLIDRALAAGEIAALYAEGESKASAAASPLFTMAGADMVSAHAPKELAQVLRKRIPVTVSCAGGNLDFTETAPGVLQNPATFDLKAAKAAFAGMRQRGYNAARVFVDHSKGAGIAGLSDEQPLAPASPTK